MMNKQPYRNNYYIVAYNVPEFIDRLPVKKKSYISRIPAVAMHRNAHMVIAMYKSVVKGFTQQIDMRRNTYNKNTE